MRSWVVTLVALVSLCCVVAPRSALAASGDAGVATPIPFVVTAPDSQPGPPPNPNDPYLVSSFACSLPVCDTLICSRDSVLAVMRVVFPDNCHTVRRVLLMPTVNPEDPLSIVLLVDDGGCLGRPCIIGYFTYVVTATLPPMLPGDHAVAIAVAETTCTDTLPPMPWRESHEMRFRVSSECSPLPPPTTCVWTEWVEANTGAECHVTIGPDQTARLTLAARSNVALAGLEGTINVWPPDGLAIVAINPIGPASGMHVAWNGTATGAKFVMFADDGAPIPPRPFPEPAAEILKVVFVPIPGHPIPRITYVSQGELLGSDIDGGEVPPCPIIAVTPAATNFREMSAHICAASGCDVNGDGRANVRDLVRMVICLHSRSCLTGFDCDESGRFDLDDILCCAHRILRRNDCPSGNCPPDTVHPHPADGVSLEVGIPVETATGIRVPIRIDGADRLGAAKLVIPFPADRYRVTGLDGAPSDWLSLSQVDEGSIVMALIRLSDAMPLMLHGPQRLELTLSLEPMSSNSDGGELGAPQGEFTDNEGHPVLIQMNAPSRPLPGGPQVQLSENRPDPFSGLTRFTITLPRAATVTLGVFDLGGRKVASLHDGALPAGSREFSWNGHDAGGGHAASGVYFYRAIVEGQTLSRKMVLLGD